MLFGSSCGTWQGWEGQRRGFAGKRGQRNEQTGPRDHYLGAKDPDLRPGHLSDSPTQPRLSTSDSEVPTQGSPPWPRQPLVSCRTRERILPGTVCEESLAEEELKFNIHFSSRQVSSFTVLQTFSSGKVGQTCNPGAQKAEAGLL